MAGRAAARLAAAAACGLLVACSAPQSRRLIEAPPAELPPRAAVDGVPFYPSPDTLCGPTSLASLLAHRGRPVDLQALRAEVYLPGRAGAVQTEMLAALRARELVTYGLEGELHAVLSEIAAGNPVLVLQNLGMDWLPRWHYAVAVGYDLAAQEVWLHSGETPLRRTGLRAFENTWRRSSRWALVAAEPARPPVTARLRPWLHAAQDLAETGQGRAAALAFAAAAGRWPDEPLALLTHANSELGAGRLASAEGTLRRALTLDPANPAAWNNLAHVLLQRGCAAPARAAARCGLRLAPAQPTLLRTLAEAEDSPDGPGCAPVRCEAVGAGSRP